MQDKLISPTTGRAADITGNSLLSGRADETFPLVDEAMAAVRHRDAPSADFRTRELQAIRRDMDSLRKRKQGFAPEIAGMETGPLKEGLRKAITDRPLMTLGFVAVLSFIFGTMRGGR